MTVDWKVVVVPDPEHEGHDFAYTVGLHDRDLPELLLWARPTDGDDPGADWMLSTVDLTDQLNELGEQLVAGALAAGASIEVEHDGGFATATMLLRLPVAAHGRGLDALEAAPGATVSEIRWSLRRRPVGPRRELVEAEVRGARARLAAFIGELAAAPVTFPASARFGPQTPVVDMLRLRTRSLDDQRTERLLAVASLAEPPQNELGAIAQASRAAGLVDQVEDVFGQARSDARVLASRVVAADRAQAARVTSTFAVVLSVAYGTEVVRHELLGPPPPCSEVLWAVLDPDGARTRRFVEHVAAIDPVLGRIMQDPDLERLAAIVEGLDGQTTGRLADLWVQTAASGHGSGMGITAPHPDPALTDGIRRDAAIALGTAGAIALDVAVPGDLGPPLLEVIRHVAHQVRATAPLRRAS